jgi:hypothetical protein
MFQKLSLVQNKLDSLNINKQKLLSLPSGDIGDFWSFFLKFFQAVDCGLKLRLNWIKQTKYQLAKL